MRIAIIADPLDNQNAGVHIFTKSLVEELCKRNDGHEYIIVRQKYDPNFPNNVKQLVIPVRDIPAFPTIRLFLRVPYALRKENVDIVIEPAHFGPWNLSGRTKRLTVIHDLTPIKFPEHHRWYRQMLQRIFLRKILNKADLVITNSHNTSKDLEEYYPSTKGKNTPILLGKDQFYKPTLDQNILNDNGIHTRYFLSVGTIEPRKNLLLLLDAFSVVLNNTDEDIHLVISGGLGWKTESFEAKLESHPHRDKIIMLGYVDKAILPALYTQAISLIYPSIYEGFGFPVLEGMSCGVPVICSDVSSLPEVGGDVAHYIHPESLDDLVMQMEKTLHYTAEDREEIKVNSIARSETFSWKGFTNKFIEEIERIVNK